MPPPKSPLAYTDAGQLFDRALESPRGVFIPAESHGAAMRLATKLNTARRRARLDNATAYPDPTHPLHNRSEWDAIEVKVMLKLEDTDQPEPHGVRLRKYDITNYEVKEL